VSATIAERVAAGAAFLDENEPGWFRLVDVASLRLEDCFSCVIGQLAGAYEDGLEEYGIDFAQSIDLGFGELGFLIEGCDYPGLTAEWKRVITERGAAS
jgi:hypothetical protein